MAGRSRSRLGNGVEVLAESMPGVGSVAVGAWIRQGPAHEPGELAGASHLLEHMVFRGTRNRSRQDIALALESVGGSLNAYTAREHTGYEARVLAAHLPLAVEVIADLVRNPLLRQSDLEREKEVVLEEIAAVEDAPDDLVFDLHADRMWSGHEYGRPIMGSRESVAAISRGDLADLHRRGYAGANMVVAAAGAVDPDAFGRLAEKWFGGIEPGREAAAPAPPPPARRGADHLDRDSAQTHIVTGAATPGHAHPDRYALLLLSAALGGGMSSRAFQRIREEQALAYSVFSYHASYLRSGVMGMYAGTRPRTAAAALDSMRELCAELAANGLSEDELERTKDQVKGGIVISLESPTVRAQRLAGFALLDEEVVPADRLPELVDAVTVEDAARVAAAVFAPERQFALSLGRRLSPGRRAEA